MVSIKNKALLFLFLFPLLNIAQCPRNIVYYKGLFHYLTLDGKVSAEGYPVWKIYDKISIENADTLSKLWTEKRNDSLWLCTESLERFYNGKKWGVFNRDLGKPVSGFEFDYVVLCMPRPLMHDEWDRPFFLARKGRYSAIFSDNGTQLGEMNYKLPGTSWTPDTKDSAYYFARPKNNLTDTTGRCVGCYEQAFSFNPSAGKMVVLEKDGKLGALDSAGQIAMAFQYDKIIIYKSGYMLGEKNGKNICLTSNGTELKDYDKVVQMFFNKNEYGIIRREFSGIFMTEKKGRWGIIDAKNNTQTTCVFEISDAINPDWYVSPARIGMRYNHGYYTLELKMNEFKILDEEGNDVKDKFLPKKP